MKRRVRIRGIYSTALTAIFSSLSYTIVQQSTQIAERFMQDIKNEPAEITIKDAEDKGRIIIMGEDIYNDLTSIFRYSFIWKSPVKLYSVINTSGNCTFMDFRVKPCLSEGLVIKPPYDGEILISEVKAVGKYAMVWRGKGITAFSEHIRDEEDRIRLLSLSTPLNRKGYNIKWRSNAKYASLNELKDELERLIIKYENKDFRDQGEDFFIVTLSLPDKLYLDDVRKMILNTIKYHHMLKLSYNREIDTAEEKGENPVNLLQNLTQDFMKIEHIKADGKVIYLKGGKVIEKEVNENNYRIVLKREFEGGGILDSIGKKIEKGDYDIVEYNSEKWYQVHKYYDSKGTLKGIYINISTPPELLRGKIRYLDLEVDLVINNNEVYLVDEEEFNRKSIYMPPSLISKTKEVIEDILRKIKENIEI
ncbi:MAG: DUF402 domain-containing protein [Saccharolobus sp.]|jgi:Ribonuclease G/E|uniref:DUF402 domain-containing protein n=1 Tax=Saccharolobus sp. TaxID=2100761 RepID=UPI0028CE62DD|nr:DUF402 domain-containing protein [Saccharolobus sp.]MDT7861283.1 DUF402 domain-containing protein [Saccharolobus sp.]